jgi:hypothetical protein
MTGTPLATILRLNAARTIDLSRYEEEAILTASVTSKTWPRTTARILPLSSRLQTFWGRRKILTAL